MNLLWASYSILHLPDNRYVLVLIYNIQADEEAMHDLLMLNHITVTLTINDKGEYAIYLKFDNADFAIKDNQRRTIADYPPLEWAAKGLVQYITTGYLAESGFQYRKDFKEISGFSFN